MKYKRCTKCGKRKLATTNNFHKQKLGKYRLRSPCKKCSKMDYTTNKIKINFKRRESYKPETGRKLLEHRCRSKMHYRINPEKHKWLRVHKKYKLGRNWREAKILWFIMLKKQRHKCAMCRERLVEINLIHTDHDHKTGKIRGLLCGRCNRFLGIFQSIKGPAERYLRNE